jgi:hypothetical protein
VALVRELFEYARRHGHLLFRTRRGERVRIPLRVSPLELVDRARAGRRETAAAPSPTPAAGG